MALVRTDVLQECIASIMKVERIGELGTSFAVNEVDQTRRFHMKTATESSLRNVVFEIKQRTNNIQNCDSYINIPASETYRSR
jgi:hypothetical protein